MKRVFSSYYFVFFIAAAATQPFLSLYLHNQGISTENIGFILACGNGAGILIQPLLGHLNDVISDSRRLLLLSAILSPIVFIGYAMTRNVAFLFVVAVLFAVVQSARPLADAMTVQEAARSGFTYGQIRLWGALSFALTTMVAGYVYHLTGIGLAFVVYDGLSLVLAFITQQLPQTPASRRCQCNISREIRSDGHSPPNPGNYRDSGLGWRRIRVVLECCRADCERSRSNSQVWHRSNAVCCHCRQSQQHCRNQCGRVDPRSLRAASDVRRHRQHRPTCLCGIYRFLTVRDAPIRMEETGRVMTPSLLHHSLSQSIISCLWLIMNDTRVGRGRWCVSLPTTHQPR